MNIKEIHKYFQNDSVEIENPDKEIWSSAGFLNYTCKDGIEEEHTQGTKEDSPFKDDEAFQAVYYFECGSSVQHNLDDDSFYFRLADDQTMSAYIDGELMGDADKQLFDEHIAFTNDLLAQ